MKLGTETSSLVNHIYSNQQAKTPEVGMGATVLLWSDRHAYTITRVSPSGKTFWMTQDIATRTEEGMTDAQDYTYEQDMNAEEEKVTLRRDGKWKIQQLNDTVKIGVRDEHHDFSF